jgi:hypothetical protein
VQRTQGKRVRRVRVELRLPPEVAASLYGWALQANLSLSEAASRAIQRGLSGTAGEVAPDALSNNAFREL